MHQILYSRKDATSIYIQTAYILFSNNFWRHGESPYTSHAHYIKSACFPRPNFSEPRLLSICIRFECNLNKAADSRRIWQFSNTKHARLRAEHYRHARERINSREKIYIRSSCVRRSGVPRRGKKRDLCAVLPRPHKFNSVSLAATGCTRWFIEPFHYADLSQLKIVYGLWKWNFLRDRGPNKVSMKNIHKKFKPKIKILENSDRKVNTETIVQWFFSRKWLSNDRFVCVCDKIKLRFRNEFN